MAIAPGTRVATEEVVARDSRRVSIALLAGLSWWGVASGDVERIRGPAFVELANGDISSRARVTLENESDDTRHYSLTVYRGNDTTLHASKLVFAVSAETSVEVPLVVDAPRASYVRGKRAVTLRVADDRGFARMVEVTLLGPR